MTRHFSARHHGFGLIEFLIAIAITLFLVAGLATIYLSNEQGSVAQRAEASLADNIRLAVTLLTTDIRQTGYRWNLSEPVSGMFTIIPDYEADPTAFLATPSNPLIMGDWANTGSALPYGLALSYQSDGTLNNCQGQLVPMGTIDTDVWKVDTATDQLECKTRFNNNGFDSYVPLVNNVETMMVRFGVDTQGTGSVSTYVSAPAVDVYSQILAVQVALLMASGDAAAPQGDVGDVLPTPVQGNYDLLGMTYTPPSPDRYLRIVVVRDIALKNLLAD
jgi:type II secretory pathway component PulJ